MLPKTDTTRKQLSMYVPGKDGLELEGLRQILDPVQFRLIPAHITLCRENELEQFPEKELQDRLANSSLRTITLQFGRAEAFGGHGILLPCTGGEEEFHLLRRQILGPDATRNQKPHITLSHPRNPRAPGNTLAAALGLPVPLSISFPTISLIQQTGQEPWTILQTIHLQGVP